MPDSFAEMRQRNSGVLITLVRERGQVSRAELARLSGLSKATVSSIVDDLLATGLLSETGSVSINRGRHPTGLIFNSMSFCACGISVDPSGLSYAAVLDSAGSLLLTQEIDSDSLDDPKAIGQAVNSAVKQAGLKSNRLVALGIAVPGPIDQHQKFSEIADSLCRKLDVPVTVDPLVSMAALSESASTAVESPGLTMFIRIGHLVRSTLLSGHTILSDRRDLGGELGHIPWPGSDELCWCGNKGCINTVASTQSILSRMRAHGFKPKNISSVVAAARRGEQAQLESITTAAQAIGHAVGCLMNLFAPLNVVLCGEIVESGNLFWTPMEETCRKQAIGYNFETSNLSQSNIGAPAPAIGAAFKALQLVDFSKLLPG